MRKFLYFLPCLLIILSYITIYLVKYHSMKSRGEKPPSILESRYMNAWIICLVAIIINFGVVYFALGHREKLQNYVLPYLDEYGKLQK